MAIKIQEERHQKLIDDFITNQKHGSKSALAPGHRVMHMCPAVRYKEGKQIAVRYFGPYIVTNIDNDGIHCNIVKESSPDGVPERVHMKLLVVIDKNRLTVPIYPAEDLVQKGPALLPRNPIIEDKQIAKHPYNTRSKNKE